MADIDTITLLTTKFHVQSVRHSNVSRTHLIDRLNAGIELKLSLISAPAGYGKSTLASEWVASLQARVQARGTDDGTANQWIAWLSLDEEDDDIHRFFTYFVSALKVALPDSPSTQKICSATLEMLSAPRMPKPEQLLTPVLNKIADLDGKVLFILDDLQFIENDAIHSAIAFFLRRAPVNLHVGILTRHDPPIGLAELRAKGELSEIRAVDLRFSEMETMDFLRRGFDLALSNEDVHSLVLRTEGWPAGLQLAGISLRETPNASEFIQDFSGSDVYVTDYLMEEVLARQPEQVQHFLMKTSIATKLTGPLCDAITGSDDGQEILDSLSRSNLFVVPLDHERLWYRYHHLFSDLLTERLNSSVMHSDAPRGPASELHERASRWYETNGYASDAIENALRAGNMESAVGIVDRCADEVWGQSAHGDLRRWLHRLPDDLLLANPRLCMYRAWYLVFEDQLSEAERVLDIAEKLIDSGIDAPGGRARPNGTFLEEDVGPMRGRIAVMRGLAASFRNDQAGQIRHTAVALELLPKSDTTFRALPSITLGDLYLHQGDVDAAINAYQQAVDSLEADRTPFLAMLSSLALAMPMRYRGRLRETVDLLERQCEVADSYGLSELPESGWCLALLGESYAELNDVQRALRYARRGVAIAETDGDAPTTGWSYHCLIRALCSDGNYDEAFAAATTAATIAERAGAPWVPRLIDAWRIRISIATGDTHTAFEWLEKTSTRLLTTQDETDFFVLFELIVVARILMVQERYPEAETRLNRLLVDAERGGNVSAAIEIRCLQAICLSEAGREDDALKALELALSEGEPHGFFQTYLDEGAPLARLLYRAAAGGIHPEFIHRLLSALPPDSNGSIGNEESADASNELFEPVTDRELEVLHLVAEGLKNFEIGERLFISTHTVKTHVKNISAKLETRNRTEAVTKARRLGLFPPV